MGRYAGGVVVLVLLCGLMVQVIAQGEEVLDIGSRLEPVVDGYLVDKLEGTALMLHPPAPGEKVLALDMPWEGRFSGYTTVLKDGELYRMYYRGLPKAGADGSNLETTCVAISVDGINWVKPKLGIFEIMGTRENNVVLADAAPFSHNFSPFVDVRPGVSADQRLKAVAGTAETGLFAFSSPDGLHWSKMRDTPIITKGAFDSHNLAFWSESEGCYCAYVRIFTNEGLRSVSRCTSADFLNWTEPVEMTFGDTPREHLYTNHTRPYFRAPHIYVSTAARFMPGRRVIPKELMEAMGGDANYSGDCSDTVFFTTRGGNAYDRTFMEGFVRPGFGYENWTSRTNYPVYGLVPVGESEMAMYVNRNYGQDSAYIQRLKLRLDGFASVNAPYAGGEMTTKPLVFAGGELVINYSTSAAGSVWVEIQDEAGNVVQGFGRENCDEIIGDEIERVVNWGGKADVSSLAGKPARLRFVMKDADLYSIRFR